MDRVVTVYTGVLACFAALSLAGCASGPAASSADGGGAGIDAGPPRGTCSLSGPTSCPSPPPRYADIAPILQQWCVSCHAGAEGGPWPLTDYSHVSDWRDDIRADMLTCAMPPPDAGTGMTDAERLTILTWIRCGLPR